MVMNALSGTVITIIVAGVITLRYKCRGIQANLVRISNNRLLTMNVNVPGKFFLRANCCVPVIVILFSPDV